MPPIVTAPETVSTELLLKDRVPVALFVAMFTIKVAQAALFTSTVTVELPTMVTLSALPGTTPPTHVAVELQLPPAAVELILAASTIEANDISINVERINLKECKCVVIKLYFKNSKFVRGETFHFVFLLIG
jgi:hypothetical protein